MRSLYKNLILITALIFIANTVFAQANEWGIHFDENGKASLYGCESDKYQKLSSDKNLTQLKGMKSKK